MSANAISTAEPYIKAPLLYKGKVRELYDLGEHYLIVVTDRISAFDYVLEPAVPYKGSVLNRLSAWWFGQTESIMDNHVVHTDVDLLPDSVITDKEALRNRIMVACKAERIDIECIVRGYVTGGGWRQYQETQAVNGIPLPAGLRKNARLEEPIFTPSAKNDIGHDEDISYEEMERRIGRELARELQNESLILYDYAAAVCWEKGIILADCKFEFGLLDGKIILIDELFTPDSSRFWAKDRYGLDIDIDIDSMDKEPVRTYLMGSDWDRVSVPAPLPDWVVEQTSKRYLDIYSRLTGDHLERE